MQLSDATSAGMLAFDHGNLQTAAVLFARALQRAYLVGDTRAVVVTAYNLAACDLAVGQYDAASSHLREAKYETSAAGPYIDQIQLLTAKADFLQQRYEQAEQESISLTSSSSPLIRIQAQTLLTLIACDMKRLTEARTRLAKLLISVRVEKDIPASVSADVEKAQGEVAQLFEVFPEAAARFDRETMLLRAAGRYRDRARSLGRAGSAYERAFEWLEAGDRYYHAAQTYAGLEDRAAARRLAAKAMAMATMAQDATLKQIAGDLINALSSTPDP